MRPAAVLSLLCLVAACGGGPREDPLPRQAVLRWNDVMTVEILAVYDVMEHHVDADPEITHTIEAKVLEGPQRYLGKTLFLPYDEWATGAEAPNRGQTVTLMPSQWVAPSNASRGAPDPRWQR